MSQFEPEVDDRVEPGRISWLDPTGKPVDAVFATSSQSQGSHAPTLLYRVFDSKLGLNFQNEHHAALRKTWN